MAKSRNKIQQLGLWDSEVSSVDHDAICLWAYRNADDILQKVYPDQYDRPWRPEEIDPGRYINNDLHWRDKAVAFAEAHSRPNPKVTSKIRESVLQSSTGYNKQLKRIVGYADLLMEGSVPVILANDQVQRGSHDHKEHDGFEIAWEQARRALA